MITAHWLARGVPVPKNCSHVYVGSDGCPHDVARLFTGAESSWADSDASKGVGCSWLENVVSTVPVTIVLPPLPESQMALLEAVLGFIRQCADTVSPLEVCANDLGTLSILAKESRSLPFVPVIGRWLARQDTDPQLFSLGESRTDHPDRIVMTKRGPRELRYAVPPTQLLRHWSSPSVLEPSSRVIYHEILAGLPLHIELDDTDDKRLYAAIEKAQEKDPLLRVTLHQNDALVCLLPCTAKHDFPTCDRCPTEKRLVHTDRFDDDLYRQRNEIFWEPGVMVPEMQQIDRVVTRGTGFLPNPA